jgi:REP-associated tyrosine transposase
MAMSRRCLSSVVEAAVPAAIVVVAISATLTSEAAETAASTRGIRMTKFPGKPPRLDTIFQKHERPLFFITFNTLHRNPVLASDAVHEAFVKYCRRGCEMGVVEVGRYVIMPDHMHLFVRGDDNCDLGLWIRGLKRALAKALPTVSNLWQPGFFDHLLRSDESYGEKWEYVRLNPVRKGLAAKSEDWHYQGAIVAIDRL